MHFLNLLPVALLIVSQAAAAPVAEPEAFTLNDANVLTKRAAPAPVSCGRKLAQNPSTKFE